MENVLEEHAAFSFMVESERTNKHTNIVSYPPLIEHFSAQLQNCEV
jgi:hypothetical protein